MKNVSQGQGQITEEVKFAHAIATGIGSTARTAMVQTWN
jgi:hypothetical protein